MLDRSERELALGPLSLDAEASPGGVVIREFELAGDGARLAAVAVRIDAVGRSPAGGEPLRIRAQSFAGLRAGRLAARLIFARSAMSAL